MSSNTSYIERLGVQDIKQPGQLHMIKIARNIMVDQWQMCRTPISAKTITIALLFIFIIATHSTVVLANASYKPHLASENNIFTIVIAAHSPTLLAGILSQEFPIFFFHILHYMVVQNIEITWGNS